MTITPYLLITLTTVAILGGWTLAVAIRRAEDGYEDAMGFSLGRLPALPVSFLRPQAAPESRRAPATAAAATPSHFSTGTSTQSVTIFVSSVGRTASPLYRRYRRSGNSASPFSAQSASPFPVQSASPFPVQSASPFPVQSASPFPTGSVPPFATGSNSPFEMQCAAVRPRGHFADSNPPIPPAASSTSGNQPTS